MTLYELLRKRLTFKIFATMLFLLVAGVFIIQPRLPVPPRVEDFDFYNQIQLLKEGDTVVWATQYVEMRVYNTDRDVFRAMLYQIAGRKANIILLSFGAQSPAVYEAELNYVNLEKKFGYKRGVNIAFFPYLAGDEPAIANIGANMQLFVTDVYGTPTKDIPFMQKIRTMADVNLVICGSDEATYIHMFVRQWAMRYGVRMIAFAGRAFVAAYYGKQILGIVASSANYELLTGYPGVELLKIHASTVVSLFVIGMALTMGTLEGYDRLKKRAAREVGVKE